MRGAHDNGSHGSKCLMGLRPGKRRDCGNGAESWEWAWAIAGTTCRSPLPRSLPGSARCIDCLEKNIESMGDIGNRDTSCRREGMEKRKFPSGGL